MKLNISYPVTGCQKLVEIDDEKKVRVFYDKRMSQEVAAIGLAHTPAKRPRKQRIKISPRQMLRLAGKRQFMREDIIIDNIIDVHQEDQIDRSEMLKNLSQDDDGNAAFAAHKAKDIPGGQSKRKHQITYLGQMAKARELDLKNQWSQNKASRRQSAMKYGF